VIVMLHLNVNGQDRAVDGDPDIAGIVAGPQPLPPEFEDVLAR
jgi:hypothetical protein